MVGRPPSAAVCVRTSRSSPAGRAPWGCAGAEISSSTRQPGVGRPSAAAATGEAAAAAAAAAVAVLPPKGGLSRSARECTGRTLPSIRAVMRRTFRW